MSGAKNTASTFYTTIPTQRGDCGLLWSRGGEGTETLLRIFTACPEGTIIDRAVGKEYPGTKSVGDGANAVPIWLSPVRRFLIGYYGGDRKGTWREPIDWPWLKEHLDWSSQSEFRKKVLQSTFYIPSGKTMTYGELARHIRRPGSARAVGGALARNPWPVIIPCHRVVGSGGALTGFSGYGAIVSKAWMLRIESTPS